MRFSRIRLENWRNFSEVNVVLQNRVFIIGANASGKSNFLDVFRFLRDLVVSGGGFQKAVESRGGVSVVRSLSARHPKTDVTIEIEINDNDKIVWRYRIVFNQDNNRRPMLKEEKIWRGEDDRPILNRPDEDDLQDKERLSQTYLEQTFANREFREITDFFKSITYSHIVPQLVRDPERSVGRIADPYGGDFLEQIAALPKGSRDARLRRIQSALKLAIPQLLSLEHMRDEKGIPHLRARYENWRSQGVWQKETEFSDGTLRLIGLLWILQEGSGPLLLEEPELSLHTGVVRYLPQMMRNVQKERKRALRQTIVSTHSSEMLQDEGIGLDEILLFNAQKEGTSVETGTNEPEISNEFNAGLSLAEIVLSRTEPPQIRQLSFFE